jgi:hypothetical protein
MASATVTERPAMMNFSNRRYLRLARVLGRGPSWLGWLLLLVLGVLQPCSAQTHSTLCNQGNYGFKADSPTGVSVLVGPPHTGSFAARLCTAELSWGKHKLIVADQVSQVDLDLFGVELTGSGPVAAFQLKKSSETCCLTYAIYSLSHPPRLLRTIEGGFFSAADTDLDGLVEIWAEDGKAADGLDDLPVTSFDFLPTYVLRLENNRLVDATREFAAHFDEIIERIRKQISPQQLSSFKQSDGRLNFSIADVERLHNLRATKIAVMEIVWNYLYSGREVEAWRSLQEMWPAGDLDRIQSAIASRRRDGILAQIDGAGTHRVSKKHTPIFEKPDVIPAEPIDIFRPPFALSLPQEVFLDLVIDSAGKVRSARSGGNIDQELLSFTKEWKFIPAMRHGHSVASRLHMAVSLKR